MTAGDGKDLPTKISDVASLETQAPTDEFLNPKRAFGMFLCGGGILFFFIFYGILQERIMTKPYGDEGAMFTYSAYLVLSNRIVAIVTALAFLYFQNQSFKPVAPLHKYFSISISNTCATFCQYEALKYVSFPTQTLGKCGKTIPVIILSFLISGKKTSLTDIAVCILITLGCTIFVLTGDISASEKNDSIYGLILMGGYMFFDGFTSVFQEKLFAGYKMSTYNQMLYVNICSAVLSILMLTATNDLVPSISFSFAYPTFFISSIGLSLCATGGQLVIYYTIKNFGALFFAVVMTTRQVVSILLSSIIYLHPLSLGQWFGIGTVFGTLFYKSVSKKKRGGGH